MENAEFWGQLMDGHVDPSALLDVLDERARDPITLDLIACELCRYAVLRPRRGIHLKYEDYMTFLCGPGL